MIDITDIKDSLYYLIEEIKNTKEYLELKESFDNLMNNCDSKKLIDEFNKRKKDYELYKSNDNGKSLSLIKSELYKNELYLIYKEKLKCYNEKMKEISKDIDESIFSDEVKELLKLR